MQFEPSRVRLTVAGRLIVAVLALFGALAVGSGAAASTYPPPDPILTLSDRSLPPNTPFEATVSGCQPGEPVTFYLVGNDPVTVTCGPDGIATTTLISPPTPGRYDVRAVLGTTGVTLISSITVTTPGTIPRTGSDGLGSTVFLGAGLVLLGGAFLVVARLRRRDAVGSPA